MAACGRNGIIYVCDKDKDYEQTHCFGNSHSSSVQSVRFLESKNQLYLASCGGDKNFVVHEETVSVVDMKIPDICKVHREYA